jgi:hypothetical protein
LERIWDRARRRRKKLKSKQVGEDAVYLSRPSDFTGEVVGTLPRAPYLTKIGIAEKH